MLYRNQKGLLRKRHNKKGVRDLVLLRRSVPMKMRVMSRKMKNLMMKRLNRYREGKRRSKLQKKYRKEIES